MLMQQLFATSNTWKPNGALVIDLDNSHRRSVSTRGFPIYWLSSDLLDIPARLMHFVAFQELTKGNQACPVGIGYSQYTASAIPQPGGAGLEIASSRPVHA